MNAANTWARLFRVTRPDEVVLHGAQFPSGRVWLDGNEEARIWPQTATGFEHLPLLDGSTVEWADGGQA